MNLEEKIISSLIYNEEYCRKVLPFTKPEYFEDKSNQVLIKEINKYFTKYNKPITKDILEIEVLNRKDITQNDSTQIPKFLENLTKPVDNIEWLIEQTEKYYQKRAVYLAILESINIIDGENKKLNEEAIPSLLQEALAVSFDTNIGHEYFESSDTRYDYYHRKEKGIRFDLEYLNKITGGIGLRPKSLTAVAARTGGGKSIFLCHTAASTLMQGKNVLYISMEMSEEAIAERIDANLMDTPIHELRNISKDIFETRLGKVKAKTRGKLVIKEYPTSSAHVGHFRALIEELKQKKNFTPDLICVDYLNICASARVKAATANSYTIIKSIAEELRALAVEYSVPVLTATQLNRCLDPNTKVISQTRGEISIKDVVIGEKLYTNNGWNKVLDKFESKQKMFKITTKSGKQIICSENHLFPIYDENNMGILATIKSGVKVGSKVRIL